jgi:hypothetical protein
MSLVDKELKLNQKLNEQIEGQQLLNSLQTKKKNKA